MKVIVTDLGQIECRLSAYVCDERTLLREFAENLDPYAKLATAIFGFEVNRKVHIPEGFIGKTGILGLGYGAGADKFYNMVVLMATAGGIDLGTMWTPEVAKRAVNTYRTKYRGIPNNGWYKLDSILATAWIGKSAPVRFGPVEIGHGYVKGPNGLCMFYANPRQDPVTGEYMFTYGREQHKIYGAKFLENIIQFLSRIVVMEAAVRISARGYNFVLQAHDELVYIVPDAEVEKAKAIIHEEMVRVPVWAPGLPLKADISHGQSYGEAK